MHETVSQSIPTHSVSGAMKRFTIKEEEMHGENGMHCLMPCDAGSRGKDPGYAVDTTMTQMMKRKRERHWLQWLDYDVDIIDNVSKTRRFVSDGVSDDIVSKMSFSDEGQDTGMLSPSPLSRREVKNEMRCGTVVADVSPHGASVDEEDTYVTPRKGKGRGQYCGTVGLMQSPTDVKIDQDLRRVALVRLALRNIEENREDASCMEQ